MPPSGRPVILDVVPAGSRSAGFAGPAGAVEAAAVDSWNTDN